MKGIEFKVDRKRVKEGDIVVVTWNCNLPDSVTLIIDNGYNISRIQLPDSGTRSVLIQRSKGKTTLRLSVVQGGKVEYKEVDVKVKNISLTNDNGHRTYQGNSTSSTSSLSGWFGRLKYKISLFIQRFTYGWRVMPENKRRTYKILLAVLIVLWIAVIFQRIGYNAGYEKGIQEFQSSLYIQSS